MSLLHLYAGVQQTVGHGRNARREVVVVIVAVGRRKASDKNDIYELAKKLLRLGLLR